MWIPGRQQFDGLLFPATIVEVNNDGTYYLRYDDGYEDKHLEEKHITVLPEAYPLSLRHTTRSAWTDADQCGRMSVQPPPPGSLDKKRCLARISTLDLSVGSVLDVRDDCGQWNVAQITEVRRASVKVNYLEWSAKWDQWLNPSDVPHRFAPFGSLTSAYKSDEQQLQQQQVQKEQQLQKQQHPGTKISCLQIDQLVGCDAIVWSHEERAWRMARTTRVMGPYLQFTILTRPKAAPLGRFWIPVMGDSADELRVITMIPDAKLASHRVDLIMGALEQNWEKVVTAYTGYGLSSEACQQVDADWFFYAVSHFRLRVSPNSHSLSMVDPSDLRINSIGRPVDCVDKNGNWCVAWIKSVIKFDDGQSRVEVHYDMSDDTQNEWIPLNDSGQSPHIQKLGSRCLPHQVVIMGRMKSASMAADINEAALTHFARIRSEIVHALSCAESYVKALSGKIILQPESVANEGKAAPPVANEGKAAPSVANEGKAAPSVAQKGKSGSASLAPIPAANPTSQDSSWVQQTLAATVLEDLQCVVCLDSRRCILFEPCSHAVTCDQCAPKLECCPICRAKIASYKRIYL